MITLVLGGVRSGKSDLAERMAAASGPEVVYVATARAEGEGLEERIAAHQRRRPSRWRTVEVGPGEDLAILLGREAETVLVDSLGTWLAGHADFDAPVEQLVAALIARAGHTVLVSDEVGLSVHPATEVGRRFQDALGELNRRVSDAADTAYLAVAGRALNLSHVDDASLR